MGYFLLYESMFDSVMIARDKYLKKDGMVNIFYYYKISYFLIRLKCLLALLKIRNIKKIN
jgi:hypothetical protein